MTLNEGMKKLLVKNELLCLAVYLEINDFLGCKMFGSIMVWLYLYFQFQFYIQEWIFDVVLVSYLNKNDVA